MLLTIAQNILKETKSTVIPTSIIGNNQASAIQVLAVIKKSIVSLARSHSWQELTKEYSFNSVVSQNNYSLPSDFDRIVNDSFWNTTTKRQLIGSVTTQEWRYLEDSRIGSAVVNDYYRFRGNELLIHPTPTAIETFKFEYISNLIVESSGGTAQTGWQADDDVPVIDSYIVELDSLWRLLKAQGRAYQEDKRELDLALAERMSINAGRKTIKAKQPAFFRAKIGYPENITAP